MKGRPQFTQHFSTDASVTLTKNIIQRLYEQLSLADNKTTIEDIKTTLEDTIKQLSNYERYNKMCEELKTVQKLSDFPEVVRGIVTDRIVKYDKEMDQEHLSIEDRNDINYIYVCDINSFMYEFLYELEQKIDQLDKGVKHILRSTENED